MNMNKIRNNFKGVIFDLDGTLLNTITDITDALNYSLAKSNLSKVTVDEAKYLVGSGAKVLIERTINKVKPEMEDKESEEYKKLFNTLYDDYMFSYNLWKYNHTIPYESVVKTLHTLKRKGIKLAVLSNKPERDTLGVVNRFFPNIFDIVRGAREGVPLKPDATAVNEMIIEMGLPKDDIFYCGDSNIDILTSQNAGLFGVGACYGFRTKKELIDCGAMDTINSAHDLLRFFAPEPDGILLLDKPYGLSSQDAINKVKKALSMSKIGHAGTLDPLATGLLVVLLGDSTKLSNYLIEDDKVYIAEVTIGKTTNTLDKEGEITEIKQVNKNMFSEEDIDNLLKSLIGKINMSVPMHSAVKLNGNKLYELARDGKTIDTPIKETNIIDLKRLGNLKYANDTLVFEFYAHVSKGTYIRSLCQEIGSQIDYPAYMTGLRRISAGKMNIKDAYTIDDIKNGNYQIIPAIKAISEYPIIEVNDYLYNRVSNGMPIRLSQNCDIVFLTYEENLIAIYEKVSDELTNDKISYKARRIWK